MCSYELYRPLPWGALVIIRELAGSTAALDVLLLAGTSVPTNTQYTFKADDVNTLMTTIVAADFEHNCGTNPSVVLPATGVTLSGQPYTEGLSTVGSLPAGYIGLIHSRATARDMRQYKAGIASLRPMS